MDNNLERLHACFDYIAKVYSKKAVSDEFYCSFMLNLALDYLDMGSKSDSHLVLKTLGKQLLEEQFEAVIEKEPLLLDELEYLVLQLKNNDVHTTKEYVFNGPKGQA